jgi:uncharacterized membrane protein
VIQQSELLVLVLALALAPLMAWTYRGIDIPNKRWLAAALGAMLTAYVTTILEGFVAPEFFNTVEHAMLMIAAACFVVASRSVLKMSGPGPDETA